jgi:Fic family protein
MSETHATSRALAAKAAREKLRRLSSLRNSLPADALENLERAQRIDITFTSNALEGNTLTAGETALVLEKGLTIGGKPLKDHLEATDHAHALDWVNEIASRHRSAPVTEADIRALHALIVAQSNRAIAGQYADKARFANGSRGVHAFPSPIEVPALMRAFVEWLQSSPDEPATAFEAHRRLVAIHPFNDGNGRTARLLMNLVLLRGGYPAIAIRPEDRPAYIAALEDIDDPRGVAAFDELMFWRLGQTLDLYLKAVEQAQPRTS